MEQIGLFLDAPGVLNFVSSTRSIFQGLGRNPRFWRALGDRQDCPDSDETSLQSYKDRFLQASYCEKLKTVEWKALRFSPEAPQDREGHVACLLGNTIVVTGGFTDCRAVCLKPHGQEWQRILPTRVPSLTYGASFTALDDQRAVMFGGFRGGGYSMETDEVAVLTVQELRPNEFQVSWEARRCTFQSGEDEEAGALVARAYHTATLLNGRYLLVVGGMQEEESMLEPVILDTERWIWLDITPVTGAAPSCSIPSPRHGHSIVLDSKRNRLVMFGGGDGSDLLRSGEDTASVWELKMNCGWQTNLIKSLPWQWGILHADDAQASSESYLDRIERLVLGRCHCAHKISRDTVVFLFGSGQPISTNGVLGYDLSKDWFIRPHVQGPVPQPRFTCCSVFLPSGHIFIHSGFSSQSGRTLRDMVLLDVCPAMDRDDAGMVVNRTIRSQAPVSERMFSQPHIIIAQVLGFR